MRVRRATDLILLQGPYKREYDFFVHAWCICVLQISHVCVTCVTYSNACAFDRTIVLAGVMVRIPLRCICCGSVDGFMDGRNSEEIQAESSRLHALVATVVVMNFEPWRDNDYNFVEKRSNSRTLHRVALALPHR